MHSAPPHQIEIGPRGAALVSDLLPALRPGERLVAGRPYVFNQDTLNDYEAALAVCNAPADLSALSASEFARLLYAAIRVAAFTCNQVVTALDRLEAERARRAAFAQAAA
jgi:hypothetical protein